MLEQLIFYFKGFLVGSLLLNMWPIVLCCFYCDCPSLHSFLVDSLVVISGIQSGIPYVKVECSGCAKSHRNEVPLQGKVGVLKTAEHIVCMLGSHSTSTVSTVQFGSIWAQTMLMSLVCVMSIMLGYFSMVLLWG
jgi:hypothetical protein